MLLKNAVDSFLLYLEAAGRSERTIASYRQRLHGFVAQYGDTRVTAITPTDIDTFVVNLRRQPHRYHSHPTRPELNHGLAPATIKGRVNDLKTFWRWCEQRGYVATSPAIHLRVPDYDLDASNRVMDAEDLAAMVGEAQRQADKGNPRNLAILLFIADTGARVGEVARLTLPNLHLSRQEATIDGKTGKGTVDYTQPTAVALQKWLDQRPACDHPHVFVAIRSWSAGKPLDSGGIYQALRRLAQKAGIQGRFNPHAIRHLVGQRWSDQTNLELVRQKLRHASMTTTARYYSHQDRTRLKKATAQFSLVNDVDTAAKEVK